MGKMVPCTTEKLGYCTCGEPLDYFGGQNESGTSFIMGHCPGCDKDGPKLCIPWVWGVVLNKLTRAERILIRGKHG